MSRTSTQCHLVARYQSRQEEVDWSLWYLPTQSTDTERTTSSFGWTTLKEKVAMDIFHYKRNDYLVIIDYYSRRIEIIQLTSLTSDCVTSRVKTVFTMHGIPDMVVSDSERQFISDEFMKFAKSWCFAQHTTNPYSPQGRSVYANYRRYKVANQCCWNWMGRSSDRHQELIVITLQTDKC